MIFILKAMQSAISAVLIMANFLSESKWLECGDAAGLNAANYGPRNQHYRHSRLIRYPLPPSTRTARGFLPSQDEGYDSSRAELCVHRTTAKAFWKTIPFASQFVLVVATFGSAVKGYLGRNLVLKKSKSRETGEVWLGEVLRGVTVS